MYFPPYHTKPLTLVCFAIGPAQFDHMVNPACQISYCGTASIPLDAINPVNLWDGIVIHLIHCPVFKNASPMVLASSDGLDHVTDMVETGLKWEFSSSTFYMLYFFLIQHSFFISNLMYFKKEDPIYFLSFWWQCGLLDIQCVKWLSLSCNYCHCFLNAVFVLSLMGALSNLVLYWSGHSLLLGIWKCSQLTLYSSWPGVRSLFKNSRVFVMRTNIYKPGMGSGYAYYCWDSSFFILLGTLCLQR